MNGVIETATGDLLRSQYGGNMSTQSDFDSGTETYKTDVPDGSKPRNPGASGTFKRWNGSAWVDIAQPVKDLLVRGSVDLDVSLGVVIHNITGVGQIRRIRRARFWISVTGADVGAKVTQPLALEFFASDAGENCEDGTDFKGGRLAAFAEFAFASQDLKKAIVALDTTIDIDSTTSFAVVDDLIRIHDGTAYEYQRVGEVTDMDTLTLMEAADNAWSINDDVSRVLELPGFEYSDSDETGEIHLKITPGDTPGDDVRLHYVLDVE